MGELAFVIVFFGSLVVFALAIHGVFVLTRPNSMRAKRLAVASLITFFGGVICLLWGMLVEPRRLEVTEHVVETKKLRQGTAIRIAHLSDLHVGIGAPTASEIASVINAKNVDLLVFTGDAVNAEHFTPEFHRIIDGVVAPKGRYGVRGNHDFRLDMGAPMAELDGVPVVIGDITLCGAAFHKPKNLAPCVDRAEGFVIAAYHSPDLVEALHNVDLYLAGHTHGGQVRLPWFGATLTMSRFGKKYEMGRYQVGATTLYVNRGVGVSPLPAPPVRFLCRPEVAIINVVGTRE